MPAESSVRFLDGFPSQEEDASGSLAPEDRRQSLELLRSLLLYRNGDGLNYTVLVLKIFPIEPQFATASLPLLEPLHPHFYLLESEKNRLSR